jgi:predicted HNH restriction endonuclease
MLDPEDIQRVNKAGLEAWHTNQLKRDRERRPAAWRREIIEQAGGQCIGCGFTPIDAPEYAAMDFHHRDPATKLFTLNSSAMSRNRDAIDAEVAKCDLICSNCHRIMHYGRFSRPRVRDKSLAELVKVARAKQAREDAQRARQTEAQRDRYAALTPVRRRKPAA